MKHQLLTIVTALSICLLGAGCDNRTSDSEPESADQAQQVQQKQQDNQQEQDPASTDEESETTETVEVPKEGKKFDPAVEISRLPDGAWHCNMNNKAHYAAMKKGNGRCPVCNMKLQQTGSE